MLLLLLLLLFRFLLSLHQLVASCSGAGNKKYRHTHEVHCSSNLYPTARTSRTSVAIVVVVGVAKQLLYAAASTSCSISCSSYAVGVGHLHVVCIVYPIRATCPTVYMETVQRIDVVSIVCSAAVQLMHQLRSKTQRMHHHLAVAVGCIVCERDEFL